MNSLDSFIQTFLNVASIGTLATILALISGKIGKRGGTEFTLIVATLILWATGSFFEGISDTFGAKLLWRNFTQIGVFLAPLAVNLFAGAYTGDSSRRTRHLMLAALAIQLVALSLIFTDGTHHIMRERTGISLTPSHSTLIVCQTLAGMVFVSFNYFLAVLAEVRFFAFLFKVPRRNRPQVLAILIGTAIPAASGLIVSAISEIIPIPIPISVFFIPSCAIVYYGVRRHGFLAVTPLAREKVLEVIDDGVLVFSEEGLILDSNDAAKKFLARAFPDDPDNPELVIRGDLSEFHRAIAGRTKTVFGMTLAPSDPPVGTPDVPADEDPAPLPRETEAPHRKNGPDLSSFRYEITMYPLVADSAPVGWLAIIRDSTELFRQGEILRVRAETDGLTGVLNRECFIAKVEMALEAGSSIRRYAFLVVDIDYFKWINDTMGHSEGDRILAAFAHRMSVLLEPDDLFGRLGGDEFGIFMERGSDEDLRAAAHALVSGIADTEFGAEDRLLRLSISTGAVLADTDRQESFELLYAKADRALYRAKDKGRNTTHFFDTVTV